MFGKLKSLFGGEADRAPLLRALCDNRSINFPTTFKLEKEVSIIGRSEAADYKIDSTKVKNMISRQHAEIRLSQQDGNK